MIEVDGKTYYDTLTNIFEPNYYEKFKIILFWYDWMDINSLRGLKQDTNVLCFKLNDAWFALLPNALKHH